MVRHCSLLKVDHIIYNRCTGKSELFIYRSVSNTLISINRCITICNAYNLRIFRTTNWFAWNYIPTLICILFYMLPVCNIVNITTCPLKLERSYDLTKDTDAWRILHKARLRNELFWLNFGILIKVPWNFDVISA